MSLGKWDAEFHKIKREWGKLAQTDATNIKKDLLQLIAHTAIQLLRNETPKDSGDTASQWQIITLSETVVEIGHPDPELVDIIDKGSGGHIIRGNPVLKFDIGGDDVFAKQIFHPGTKPQPFIHRVQDIMNDLMLDFVETVLANHSPLFKTGRNKVRINRDSNIANVQGLAGFNRNIGRGRITMTRVRTGRRVFKRRIGRRRRTGQFIGGTKVEIG